MAKKISELPVYNGIPEDPEFVLPVFVNGVCNKKISIPEVIEAIKKRVAEGGEVCVVEVDGGFKFQSKPAVN